jgi:hypothetical protein
VNVCAYAGIVTVNASTEIPAQNDTVRDAAKTRCMHFDCVKNTLLLLFSGGNCSTLRTVVA